MLVIFCLKLLYASGDCLVCTQNVKAQRGWVSIKKHNSTSCQLFRVNRVEKKGRGIHKIPLRVYCQLRSTGSWVFMDRFSKSGLSSFLAVRVCILQGSHQQGLQANFGGSYISRGHSPPPSQLPSCKLPLPLYHMCGLAAPLPLSSLTVSSPRALGRQVLLSHTALCHRGRK